MTHALPLAYGLVALLEEGEADRPGPPAPPPTSDPPADHLPLTCTCVACTRWRRQRGYMDPQ